MDDYVITAVLEDRDIVQKRRLLIQKRRFIQAWVCVGFLNADMCYGVRAEHADL
jgi:hypothetical protein